MNLRSPLTFDSRWKFVLRISIRVVYKSRDIVWSFQNTGNCARVFLIGKKMWNTVLLYGLSVLIVVGVYYRWSRRKVLAAVAHMNGPPKVPLLGHLYLMKFTSPEQIFHHLTSLAGSHQSPMCIHLGPIIAVCVYKPEHLQAVLTSPHCISRAFVYDFFRVSKGLFSSPSHIWKGQRKVLNHSFGPGILNSFVSIFNEKSAILTTMMGLHVGKGERDFTREIARCTLDTIYSTAFGLNFDMQQSPEGNKYLDLQEEFMELVLKRMFSVTHYIERIYRMSKEYKREQEILRYARILTNRVMEARNADEILSGKVAMNQPEVQETDGKMPQIFLDKLLELARENKQHLAVDDISEHLDTIIFAGNDTTATTMSNLLLMMAMHPDVQERVYQEIMEACPDADQPVSIEETTKLVYTEMVCKETMRLFPVGPVIGRVAEADIQLSDKHVIPARSMVFCGYYMVHHDCEIWGPKANEFNPDNFLPENISKIHPYAYLPFSGGLRNCIGVRYAWISMKIMIVHILRKYRLKTSLTMDKLTLKFCVILKIGNGCFISLEKRQ
ncbi:probable cytochrome P450 313a4 [Ochlerotatus camptorhynchus]|uniref:probable cytochrome P450 313a4 n=1 Tax=Ochlerotatus camptorhynchus TaxID=644619 RepID=UPI0031DBA0A3